MQGDRHFTYDERGNLIRETRGKDGKLVTTFDYNLNNQLIAVTKDGQRTNYRYDPLGRRIEKRDTFGSTRYLWAGDQLVQEQRGEIKKTYIYEPESFKPVALIQDGERYHYHLDHLGTPKELSSEQGKVVWKARYKAYGNLALKEVDEVENNLRFQGQYFDEETGLHYNRHRYYNPNAGQFTQQDPIGLLGGVNNYQYAPNPISWVDPLGLKCKENNPNSISNPNPNSVGGNNSGLTPKQIAALSPTLTHNIGTLTANDWKFKFDGDPNGGCYACSGLMTPDTLMRDNYCQQLRCQYESKTFLQAVPKSV